MHDQITRVRFIELRAQGGACAPRAPQCAVRGRFCQTNPSWSGAPASSSARGGKLVQNWSVSDPKKGGCPSEPLLIKGFVGVGLVFGQFSNFGARAFQPAARSPTSTSTRSRPVQRLRLCGVGAPASPSALGRRLISRVHSTLDIGFTHPLRLGGRAGGGVLPEI